MSQEQSGDPLTGKLHDLDKPAPATPKEEPAARSRVIKSDSRFGEPVPVAPGSKPPGYGGYGGYGGAGYGAGYGSTDEVHLVDYLRVLHKRRWTAVSAFLIVFLTVTIYTFTATPLYVA